MQYFLCYSALINAVSAIVCIADKNRARKHKSRVSEKTLFSLSLLGGAAAMYITMLLIRHKTKHKRFMIGLPLIILLHIAIIICIFYEKTVTL